jgi:hypothetical protein
MLTAWVWGTFIFTALFNWTVNGRSILPMAPAVGILLARQWRVARAGMALAPLALSAVFAVMVARADYVQAMAVRQSARQASDRYGRGPTALWFEGHWGFQYYLMTLGGKAVELERPGFRDGDILALPLNNSNLNFPGPPVNGLSVAGPRFLSDMNIFNGGGFYSSKLGPLPFVFGRIDPENVAVYVCNTSP